MALQDLTPQLRTRLSRMERAVGWFVILATALLLFGFGYYIYNRAETKGWFLQKIRYQTSIGSGVGLKEGDDVRLMGFDVGKITRIQPNGPYEFYNITVDFYIKAPNFGYIWSDSTVKVAAGDFLGNRYLEIVKGRDGLPTVHENTNRVADGILLRDYFNQQRTKLTKIYTNDAAKVLELVKEDAAKNQLLYYTNFTGKPYWIEPEESPAVTERLEKLVVVIKITFAHQPHFMQVGRKDIGIFIDGAVLHHGFGAPVYVEQLVETVI